MYTPMDPVLSSSWPGAHCRAKWDPPSRPLRVPCRRLPATLGRDLRPLRLPSSLGSRLSPSEEGTHSRRSAIPDDNFSLSGSNTDVFLSSSLPAASCRRFDSLSRPTAGLDTPSSDPHRSLRNDWDYEWDLNARGPETTEDYGDDGIFDIDEDISTEDHLEMQRKSVFEMHGLDDDEDDSPKYYQHRGSDTESNGTALTQDRFCMLASSFLPPTFSSFKEDADQESISTGASPTLMRALNQLRHEG